MAENGSSSKTPTQLREFSITRVFDAPRELVWKAWTEPQRLTHWWGPKGFKTRVVKLDLRPGGVFHYYLRSPDGHDMWGKFVYRKIVAPQRMVFVVSFSDQNEGMTHHPLSPDWPMEILSTVTLTEQQGKTMLTVKWVPINATESERKTFEAGHDSMQQGWTGTLDQLTAYLESAARELVITRLIDAPREAVFQAWTDPQHLQRWWGPKGFTNPVCELDLQPGGAIRIDMCSPDGTVYPMTGVFHQIVKPQRLVFACAALDDKGHPLFEVLNTVTFADHGEKTQLILDAKVIRMTAEAASYLAGMEQGWSQSLDRLEQHMTKVDRSVTQPDDQMVLITRIFDAPRELVFKAWTDSQHLARWYAPRGCTIHFCDVDFRPGGVLHFCIRNPNFGDCWCKGFYREIVEPQRIVFTVAFADEKGNFVETGHVGKDPDWPRETVVTVTFAEHEGKTKLTLHQTVLESVAKRTGAYPSWLEMLDRLAEELAKT